MVLSESGGLQSPSSLARTPMLANNVFCRGVARGSGRGGQPRAAVTRWRQKWGW